MKQTAFPCVLLLVLGCAHRAVESRLTWKQMHAFAEIAVEDPTWEADVLRIPINVQQKAGDSVCVLSFAGEITDDVITISAKRRMSRYQCFVRVGADLKSQILKHTMPRLAGKVAVITGANQGIGKGIARAFAAEGAAVALCARNAEKLAAATAELEAAGAKVWSRALDITNEQAVDAFFAEVLTRFGRVDILVNNAGAFDGGRIDQVSLAAWNTVIGACLTGTFLCSRRAFAAMKDQGGGRILNIGSISAQRPREGSGPYSAAKFGVWGLTQATALDGRPFGIVCSCLHPGNVRVERRQESGIESNDEPMMEIETIAAAALAMVTLPADVNMLEAIVLPVEQTYLGRG